MTEVLSLIVAMLAVVVGPVVSYYVAKKQIWASTVSSSRQTWINELRVDIAAFLEKTSLAEELRFPPLGLKLEDSEKILNLEAQAGELYILIRLRLNPNEQEHKDLDQALGDLADFIKETYNLKDHSEKYLEHKRRVIEKARIIFKKEWERIKKQS